MRLLDEIEEFLTESGMGRAYFGRLAANNPNLVSRLENGGRVFPETEERVRDFIKQRTQEMQRR